MTLYELWYIGMIALVLIQQMMIFWLCSKLCQKEKYKDRYLIKINN